MTGTRTWRAASRWPSPPSRRGCSRPSRQSGPSTSSPSSSARRPAGRTPAACTGGGPRWIAAVHAAFRCLPAAGARALPGRRCRTGAARSAAPGATGPRPQPQTRNGSRRTEQLSCASPKAEKVEATVLQTTAIPTVTCEYIPCFRISRGYSPGDRAVRQRLCRALVRWSHGSPLGPGPALGVRASAGAWWPFAARPARRSSAWRASKITPPTTIPIPAPARTSRG